MDWEGESGNLRSIGKSGIAVCFSRFRSFSYATILAMLVFGLLVGLQTSAMIADQPTPWLGVEERVNAYASMLWLAALAAGLLRAQATVALRQEEKPTITQLPLARYVAGPKRTLERHLPVGQKGGQS